MVDDHRNYTAEEILQHCAILSYCGNKTSWDLYNNPSDKELLETKVKFLVKDEKIASDLINQLWRQARYNQGTLQMKILVIAITFNYNTESPFKEKNCEILPIFRVKKCTRGRNNSKGCCNIFVDVFSRVYKNWSDFIENNTLPAGLIIFPKNGVIEFDTNKKIILNSHLTPARSNRFLRGCDKVVAFIKEGSELAWLLFSFAPQLAIARMICAGVTMACGAYLTTRGIQKICDKYTHEESIGWSNAGSEWRQIMNGLTSAVTMGASVSTDIVDINNTAIMGTLAVAKAATIVKNIHNSLNADRSDLEDWKKQFIERLTVFTHSVNNREMVEDICRRANENSGQNNFQIVEDYFRNNYDQHTAMLVSSHPTLAGEDLIISPDYIPEPPLNSHQLWPEVNNLFDEYISYFGNVSNRRRFRNALIHILAKISKPAVIILIEGVRILVQRYLPNLERLLRRIIPFEELVFLGFRMINEMCSATGELQRYFENITDIEIADKIKDYIESWIIPEEVCYKCKDCPGFYTISY